MKKIIGAMILAAGIMTTASAQTTHFGLKAGANVARITEPDGADFASKVGVHFGGLAHIHVSQHFAVQPEIVYSMQGTEIDNSDYKLKLNYVNVPVLAQYMFKEGFRLQTGPQIGFLTSAKTTVNGTTIDQKDNYKTVDVSWAFGAGYLFPQGFGIDARYNLGLTDIASTPVTYKNRVFQVGLFYQFMHNK